MNRGLQTIDIANQQNIKTTLKKMSQTMVDSSKSLVDAHNAMRNPVSSKADESKKAKMNKIHNDLNETMDNFRSRFAKILTDMKYLADDPNTKKRIEEISSNLEQKKHFNQDDKTLGRGLDELADVVAPAREKPVYSGLKNRVHSPIPSTIGVTPTRVTQSQLPGKSYLQRTPSALPSTISPGVRGSYAPGQSSAIRASGAFTPISKTRPMTARNSVSKPNMMRSAFLGSSPMNRPKTARKFSPDVIKPDFGKRAVQQATPTQIMKKKRAFSPLIVKPDYNYGKPKAPVLHSPQVFSPIQALPQRRISPTKKSRNFSPEVIRPDQQYNPGAVITKMRPSTSQSIIRPAYTQRATRPSYTPTRQTQRTVVSPVKPSPIT